MGLIITLIIIALVIAIGIFWGRNTIQKDTMRKEHDEEELDKLHQLRGWGIGILLSPILKYIDTSLGDTLLYV